MPGAIETPFRKASTLESLQLQWVGLEGEGTKPPQSQTLTAALVLLLPLANKSLFLDTVT